MARTFLTALDLRGNELRNARVQNLAGAPADPAAGQLYYHSGSNELFWFDGTEWVSAKAAGPAGGDLDGSFPNPVIRAGAINNSHVAADAAIDVTKLAGLGEAVRAVPLDELTVPGGDLDLNGKLIHNVEWGMAPTDAANCDYVDSRSQSVDANLRAELASVRDDFANADNLVRADFAAADDDVRADFAAADTAVRGEFAAADTALGNAVQAQFQAAQEAAVADHASIRADFATADTAVRTDFAAADAAVRDEFADADDDVRAEFAAADAAVTTAYTAADTTLRTDFNAADAAIRTDFAGADTALDATLRTYVDNANASLTSASEAALTDLRDDFVAADTALDTTLRAYIDSRAGGVEGDTAAEFTAIRGEFAAADTAIRGELDDVADTLRTEYGQADDLIRDEIATADTAVRGEFAAADTALGTAVRGEFAAADTALGTAVRGEFAAADTALRQDFVAADAALDTSLRGLITGGETALRNDLEAGDDAAQAFAIQRANHTGTQLSATISDLDATIRGVSLDQMAVPADDLSVEGYRLTNVGAPVDAMDAANKGYVDALNQGLDVKPSVRAASTGNVTRSGTQNVDGVDLAAGDRVLLKDQSDASQNGIYTVSTGAWQRTGDANDPGEVTAGMFTFVEEGATYGDSGWVLVTDGDITLGTTPLAFSQFSGAGQIEAGEGLTKDGNTLHVQGTEGRIQVNADSVDIDADYVGQGSISTVGTLTEGALGAGFATVAVEQGGTGATTPLEARQNLGAATKAAFTLNSSATSYNLVHGFATRDVVVQVHENIAPFTVVDTDVEITDLNTVTVRFGVAPAANAYRVVVVG